MLRGSPFYYGNRLDLVATVCGKKTDSKSVYARQTKRDNVFIQTDKPIYKPGQRSRKQKFLYVILTMAIPTKRILRFGAGISISHV